MKAAVTCERCHGRGWHAEYSVLQERIRARYCACMLGIDAELEGVMLPGLDHLQPEDRALLAMLGLALALPEDHLRVQSHRWLTRAAHR
jgi:hypothetical protein